MGKFSIGSSVENSKWVGRPSTLFARTVWKAQENFLVSQVVARTSIVFKSQIANSKQRLAKNTMLVYKKLKNQETAYLH